MAMPLGVEGAQFRTVFDIVSTMTEQRSNLKRCSYNVRHVPPTTTSDAPEGRRARQRRQLLADIEAEARRLLEEGGAANVSMRAIARAVGVGPASLYTYFGSLDDVFTMLLLASYKRLSSATAAVVAAFADDPPADRALVSILAHRHWALAHRNEFNLIFTDQLPGYAAPRGGPTVAAQFEVFQPMLDALHELAPADPDLTPDEMAAIVWTAFHGAVILEVNHHLDWLGDTAALHEKIVRRALTSIRVPEPRATVRRRFERWAASAVAG
jgi:AcrR family transcriptional regulator